MPKTYQGDWARLRQILLNLLSNAIKFTDVGSIRLAVTPVSLEGDMERVRIEVTDTGVGIPHELQQRVLEPFFSVERPGAVSTESGPGLGLDIVRRNVEFLDREVSVASEEGAGTTFTIELALRVIGKEALSSVSLYETQYDKSR